MSERQDEDDDVDHHLDVTPKATPKRSNYGGVGGTAAYHRRSENNKGMSEQADHHLDVDVDETPKATPKMSNYGAILRQALRADDDNDSLSSRSNSDDYEEDNNNAMARAGYYYSPGTTGKNVRKQHHHHHHHHTTSEVDLTHYLNDRKKRQKKQQQRGGISRSNKQQQQPTTFNKARQFLSSLMRPIVGLRTHSTVTDDDDDDDDTMDGGGDDDNGSITASFRSYLQSGDSCSVRDFQGQATIMSTTMGMAKNLVGSGVLSLSGGIAQFANNKYAILPATFWIVLLSVVFAYFAILIAKVCKITRSATYRECWDETFDYKYGLYVAIMNAALPAMGLLAYCTILSETLLSLFETVGWTIGRVMALYLVSIFALLPLCLLKNIHVLAPFSVLGTFGVCLTAGAMIWRSIDGSYQPGGRYYGDIDVALQPAFGDTSHAWSVEVLPLVCMMYQAYVMHYNAPRFYTELKSPSTLRFAAATSGSFGLAACIYIAIASAGFLTFGGNTDSYVLNNYSPRDPLATLCRLAVALSTLTIFPLAFIGFRDGVLDIFHVPPERQTSHELNVLTVTLLTGLTVVATFISDLGVINAVAGGAISTAVVFVFPALMYRRAVNHLLLVRAKVGQRREVQLALVLMSMGVIFGIVGVREAVIDS